MGEVGMVGDEPLWSVCRGMLSGRAPETGIRRPRAPPRREQRA